MCNQICYNSLTHICTCNLFQLTYSEDFWRDVIWRSNCHVGLHGSVGSQPETGAEVGQSDVSVGVQKDIVRFDIPGIRSLVQANAINAIFFSFCYLCTYLSL